MGIEFEKMKPRSINETSQNTKKSRNWIEACIWRKKTYQYIELSLKRGPSRGKPFVDE